VTPPATETEIAPPAGETSEPEPTIQSESESRKKFTKSYGA
jgi:hypothetical protein